jgi:hypothetical protein
MTRPLALLILGALTVPGLSACAAAPLERPLNTSPIAEGPGTVEAARRVLEGRWELVSLNVSAEDGRQTGVEAVGLLVFDAFGNLTIEYRMSEAGVRALAGVGITPRSPLISTTGRAMIDTQSKRVTYVPPDAASRPFDPDLAAARANPFALERTRYYAVDPDGILVLTTRYDSGRDAGTARWKKSP